MLQKGFFYNGKGTQYNVTPNEKSSLKDAKERFIFSWRCEFLIWVIPFTRIKKIKFYYNIL